MHTLEANLKKNRSSFIVAVILSAAVALGIYFNTLAAPKAFNYFVGFTIGNLLVWWFMNAVAKVKVVYERNAWEKRMHRALAMVNEAAKYYDTESGTIMAAYHGHVGAVQREGFEKNYILKSLL